MLPFKVILFDLGNTLIYFDTDWPSVLDDGSRRLTRTLVASGFRLKEDDFAKEFIANLQESGSRREQDFVEITSETVLRKLLTNKGYPGVNSNFLRPALNAFYSITQTHWLVENDAVATLSSVQALGCQLGIISNSGDPQDVYTLIKKAGLHPYFKKIWISLSAAA